MRPRLILFFLLVLLPAAGAWAQDPAWAEVAPLPTPRADAAVAVLGGQVYVIGGRDASGVALGVVERYDPDTNTWATVGALRDARYNAAATAFGNGILLTGGREQDGEVTDDVEFYDLAENRWESFDHLESEREGHAAFAISGWAYVFGGSDEYGTLRDDAEVYDVSVSDWYAYSPWTLNVPRAAFAVAQQADGVILFGGYSTFGPLAEVERYVPGQGGVMLADLPEPRGGLAGAGAFDLVWAVGGRNAANQVLDRVDVYSVADDRWDPATPLPVPREGHVAAAVDSTLYVFGGRDAAGALIATSLGLVVTTPVEAAVPEASFALSVDGPNPFRAQTALALRLDRPDAVTVAAYDALGRRVAVLHDGLLPAGLHRLVWTGADAAGRALPGGVYVVRAATASQQVVRRLTRVR